ncbi:MAG: cation transporter [Gammaproteobacteria bacterium]|jgi:Co/Zn/Cd efflux system component
MSGCECEFEIKNKEESRVLMVLLGINAVMFLVEITLGIVSESTALIADSLDMLADATVYGIGLYAVGRPLLAKIRAAHISGLFQLTLGASVLVDVLRRLVWGSEPESLLMISIGVVALVANVICLKLISKHREGEIHMRASWVFSKNDVIANLGIIAGGVLVYALGSRFPDLLIGLAISIIVIRGGIHILKDASNEIQQITKCAQP